MQSMARWEWRLSKHRLKRERIAREREAERQRREAAKRAAERRAIREREDLPSEPEERQGAAVQAQSEGDASGQDPLDTVNKNRPASASQTPVSTATPELHSLQQQTPQLLPSMQPTPSLQPLEPATADSFAPAGQPAAPLSGHTGALFEARHSKPMPRTKLRKSFKTGKGDSLEMSKSPALFITGMEEGVEPHGFRLQDPARSGTATMQVPPVANPFFACRLALHFCDSFGRLLSRKFCSDPLASKQARIGDYAPLQAAHAMNASARRPSSVPPLPPKWTQAKQTHLENSFSLAGKSQSGETKRATGTEDHTKETAVGLRGQIPLMKLREHFKTSLKSRQCPQTGNMSENARRDMLSRKAERLEAARILREVIVFHSPFFVAFLTHDLHTFP